MELNEKELEELKLIVNDKYSYGAFSGMITNLTISNDESVDSIIKTALNVRIQLKALTDNIQLPPQ